MKRVHSLVAAPFVSGNARAIPPSGAKAILDPAQLEDLIVALSERGYRVIGPTVRDGCIVYDELEGARDLPWGYTDEQDGGRYRLHRRDDGAAFGYAVGPHSWKQFLHPPALRLWRARREGAELHIEPEPQEPPRYAFLGVRSCELHAIAIQDQVFGDGPYVDPAYRARRAGVFVAALNCAVAGGTCFCASMGTGPQVTLPFDLALTELLDAEHHLLLVESGSDAGAEILDALPHRQATPQEAEAARAVVAGTASRMGRHMVSGVHELLQRNLEHPRWDDVARRCLTCGNCTLVCPTCFCTTVEDTSDVAGRVAERVRRWDSCFTLDFSYIHGGSVRASTRSRYRQWMTHKLSTWHEQFGTSGCVGCGRCITWCPVGIDITEEARAMDTSEKEAQERGKA
jgi:sulfhydrogenase subunit beta (sulfur reductase)